MTVLDVHLTGLSVDGQEIGEIFAFWLDGFALKNMLAGKLKPVDPWPAWEVVVGVNEIKQFVLDNPSVWQENRDEFNMRIASLLEKSTSIRVLIQEA